MSTRSLIQLRRRLKRRIPEFKRQESWRYKRVKRNWRRPRGKTSKMRRRQRGWPKVVSVGYGTPRRTRHLHPSGYREVIVHNPDELAKVDPKGEVARIAHTVGERKRLRIVEKATDLGIRLLNAGRAEVEGTAELPVEEASG